jgi:GTP pyrophosphokinase
MLTSSVPTTNGERYVAAKLSNTQIDRLGDRLRHGSLVESDLRLLDDYRRSFGEAYETVVRAIRERLQLEPTGRPAKSTSALREKLHRESIRLTQVQDIAGCRLVSADVPEQDRVVDSLCSLFPTASVIDRRANPSYGYRAVHLIAQMSGKLVEIQVRTSLQHLWAEFSEKLSDVVDPAIKYGGGGADIRDMLTSISHVIAEIEQTERGLVQAESMIAHLRGQDMQEDYTRQQRDLRQRLIAQKQPLVELLNRTISAVERVKRPKP